MTAEQITALLGGKAIEECSPEELARAHAKIDEEVNVLRSIQGALHVAQTAKEDEEARAKRSGNVQKVGG